MNLMATCHEGLVLKLFNPAFWAESRQKEAKHFDLQIAGWYGLPPCSSGSAFQADRSTGHLAHVQKRHWLSSDRVCRRLGSWQYSS